MGDNEEVKVDTSAILKWIANGLLGVLTLAVVAGVKEVWELNTRITTIENRADNKSAIEKLDRYVDRLEDKIDKRLEKLEGRFYRVEVPQKSPPKEAHKEP
jgi:hypothetical protein